MAFRAWPRLVAPALGAFIALVAVAPVLAQFGPPSTIWGSVTDEQGTVAAGLRVEAYVGSTLCGVGATEFTGDGPARVTVYWVDVVAREQTAGCGNDGADVRVKIGDRFASQSALWRSGPVHLDVTFGNIAPAPIPTFTPTPPPPARSATAVTTASAQATAPGTAVPGETETPTPGSGGKGGAEIRPGGLTTATDAANVGGDDGFPVWGILLIGAGVVGLAGVTVGIVAARRARADDRLA